MAEIRLNKIMRQFNIGLSNLVDFLQGKGVEVDANPNAKVSEELMPEIEKAFGKDLEAKKAAEQVDIKISEILEKSGKKKKEAEVEDYEPEKVITIKSNTFINDKKQEEVPEPVIVPQPEPEPHPELQPEPQPEPEPLAEPE
ncbi:MAG: hypothetical protein KIG19_02575, partial [Bacteroidales bacterium]|nr:hypothetical protein [Bacteroidales bacterium]